MKNSTRSGLAQALLLVTALAFTGTACADTATSYANDGADYSSTNTPSAGAMAFDLLIVRPLGIAATALGTALFIVNLPLSVVEQDAPAKPFQQLVVRPLDYTFRRPLGQMD